jgi:hypothetical protein
MTVMVPGDALRVVSQPFRFVSFFLNAQAQ